MELRTQLSSESCQTSQDFQLLWVTEGPTNPKLVAGSLPEPPLAGPSSITVYHLNQTDWRVWARYTHFSFVVYVRCKYLFSTTHYWVWISTASEEQLQPRSASLLLCLRGDLRERSALKIWVQDSRRLDVSAQPCVRVVQSMFICTYDWVFNPVCCSRHLLVHIYGLDLTDTLMVCTFNEPKRLVLVRKKWATLPAADEQFIFFPHYIYHLPPLMPTDLWSLSNSLRLGTHFFFYRDNIMQIQCNCQKKNNCKFSSDCDK